MNSHHQNLKLFYFKRPNNKSEKATHKNGKKIVYKTYKGLVSRKGKYYN